MSSTELDLGAKVDGSPERNSGVSWPLAVDRRLDQILEFAVDSGERTTRKELVAALLVAYVPDEESLAAVLRSYRKSKIADVLLDTTEISDGSVTFISNRSGPRRTRTRGGGDRDAS